MCCCNRRSWAPTCRPHELRWVMIAYNGRIRSLSHTCINMFRPRLMHRGASPRSISNLPLLRSTASPKRPIAHTQRSRPSTCRYYRQIPEEEYRRRLAEARPLLSNKRAKTLETIGTTKQHRTFILLCVAAAVVFYFANSQKVPVTGRRRFNFLSEDWLTIFGVSGDAYEQELRREGVRFAPKYDWRYARVMSVMQRLVPVSGQADKDWKVHVILDDGRSMHRREIQAEF